MFLKNMNFISIRFNTTIFITFLLLFLASTPVSAETENTYMILSPDYELELVIPPPEYEVVPDYNDGVIVIDVNEWNYIVFWKDLLPQSIARRLELTAENGFLGTLTQTFFLPAFAILISLPFFIIFSRRMNPEEEENSTPARILSYLRYHPASPLQRIVDAVGVSRGSVSYQIMRLEKEGKIVSQEIHGRRYYSSMQSGITPLSAELFRILSHKRTREIFLSLLKKPNQTISLIAEDIGRTPNAVGYQMKKISNAILVKTEEKRNTCYSLHPEAIHLYHSLFPNA